MSTGLQWHRGYYGEGTGAYDLTFDGKGVFRLGRFSSTTQGYGKKISPSTSTGEATCGMQACADDRGAVLYQAGSVNDLRTLESRFLLTTDHSGGFVRLFGLQGHLKGYGAAWNSEQAAGLHGKLELSGTSKTFGGYGVSAGVAANVQTSGTITIGANHVLAGFAAVSDFEATLTQTGKTAAFLAKAYDTTNWSDSTTRTTWGYGLYIPVGATGQAAIQLGDKASTNGSGITVNAAPSDSSGIAGILKVYGDLGGVVPANAVDINAVESRFLVATDCSAASCSIKALRGHLRVAGGKLPSGSNAGVIGYLEMDGTSYIGTNETAAVMAMVDISATSGSANNVASAFCACSNGLSLTTARSSVLHIPSTGFTSFLDIGAATGFVTSSVLSGGTSQYLTIYIANKAYTILCTTTT